VTNAIVNNGETIILGGLIKNSGGKNSVGIPVLGEIPLMKKLFSSDADIGSKLNVVIYLTPYIVRKSGDLQRLRTALTELEDIQTRYNSFVKRGLEQKSGFKDNGITSRTGGNDASHRIRHQTPTYNGNVFDADSLEEN